MTEGRRCAAKLRYRLEFFPIFLPPHERVIRSGFIAPRRWRISSKEERPSSQILWRIGTQVLWRNGTQLEWNSSNMWNGTLLELSKRFAMLVAGRLCNRSIASNRMAFKRAGRCADPAEAAQRTRRSCLAQPLPPRPHHLLSTFWCQPCILTGVHSALPVRTEWTTFVTVRAHNINGTSDLGRFGGTVRRRLVSRRKDKSGKLFPRDASGERQLTGRPHRSVPRAVTGSSATTDIRRNHIQIFPPIPISLRYRMSTPWASISSTSFAKSASDRERRSTL
jgi:hypothetical protein